MAIIGEQTSWYDQPTTAKDSFWIGCPFLIGLFNLIKFDASQKDIKWPVVHKIDPFVKLLVIGQLISDFFVSISDAYDFIQKPLKEQFYLYESG